MKQRIEDWNKRFANANPEEILKYFMGEFGNKIALSSSLSLEDQMITDIMVRIAPDAHIFTLDTGRLFPEAYQLIDRTNRKYNIRIKAFFPDFRKVEEMTTEGINLFYDSVEKRKKCCHIRKIEPLQRAFSGLDAWICGLRREQSVTRKEIQPVEWDELNGLLKINPLIHYTEVQVWKYIRKEKVPYNPLHDKNYPSIGCEPCTRPVEEGEDVRAGRWWWESPEHKECGLHRR